MKPTTAIVGFTLAATLSACSTTSGPSVISANQASITYRVAADKVETAKAAAEEHCAKRGLRAVLDRITPDGKNAIASYYCVR